MDNKFDLVVIGAGSGGYTAAIKAADLGMKVAVIEKDNVGGTCLNRGCIPTKTLIHSAELLNELKSCEEIGINVDKVTFDIRKIHERKDEVVGRLRLGIEGLFKSRKITLFKGTAKVLSADKIKIQQDIGDIEVNTDKILIATGSKPIRPAIPGIDLENVITSDELLDMKDSVPRSLTIIGGGVIGVEFATIYNALGCEVTIIEAMDRILPIMDREISQNLTMILKKRGIIINTSARVEKIVRDKNLIVQYSQKEKKCMVNTEIVLVAIGRKANVDSLFGENFDVEMQKNAIVVNNKFETSVKGIYAIGDVIAGGIQLAHAASAQGINAVLMMNDKKPQFNLNMVPSCIYTSPEISSVGITQEECKNNGINVSCGKFSTLSNGRSIISSQERGFVKAIFDEDNRVLLGAQMMCANATDMISEFTTAIVNKLTYENLSAVIRPHPTYNENITEAIENSFGVSTHTIVKR